MTSKIARGVRALIGALAVAIVALIAVAPTATAAVSGTVQHHAPISVAAPRTAVPASAEAADAVDVNSLAQPANSDGSQGDYATANTGDLASSLPASIFADVANPCAGINWLDD